MKTFPKKYFSVALAGAVLVLMAGAGLLSWRGNRVGASADGGIEYPASTPAPAAEPIVAEPQPPASLEIPIVVYHSVKPAHEVDGKDPYTVSTEAFAREMAWLAERQVTTVTFSRYLDALEGRGEPLPERSVVIAFDDAWRNQYDNAWPSLKRHGFVATFFAFANPVGKDDRFMTWEQLKELVAAGSEVGSHSWYHPRLYKVTDPDELRHEVVDSKARLEENLGVEVTSFAYPFGVTSDAVRQAVVDAGYRGARLFPGGVTNDWGHRFDLKSSTGLESQKSFERLFGWAAKAVE